MKTNLKPYFICLVFLAGVILNISALGHVCGPSFPGTSRTWRLEEQTVQIDSSGTWDNTELSRNYYAPNSFAVLDSTVYSYFDDTLGWTPANTDCFYYDATGLYVTEIQHKLIFMGEAWLYERSTFAYDDNHRITHAAVQIQGGIDREWVDFKRMDLFYLDNGWLDKIISWGMGDPEHPPTYTKSIFTLDTVGRISNQLDYFSEDSTNWVQDYQTTYNYHPNDNTTGASLVEMISKTLPFSLTADSPLQIGMIGEKIRQIWLYNYWANDSKDTYTYTTGTGDRSLTYHTGYEWFMGGGWQNKSLNTYTYDNYDNLSSELLQNWNADNLSWQNYMLIDNSWGQSTANDDNVSPAINGLALTAYPNPFREDFEIAIGSKSKALVKLEIFNAKGQKVHQEMINPSAKTLINSKTLKQMKGSGVYFLKATQGTETTSRKIIRLK